MPPQLQVGEHPPELAVEVIPLFNIPQVRRSTPNKEVWRHADNTGGAKAVWTSTEPVIASQLRPGSFKHVSSGNSYRFSNDVADAIHYHK